VEAHSLNRRPIRSFVLRQGRFSPAQQRAHETLLPRFGIAFAREALDLERVFARSAPKILEIGSGMGETTVAIARAMPECDFLAIEVHAPGVGSLLKRIDELGLANLRVIQHDAVEVVREMIAPGTLAAIHVFFPDPWPKRRHHKRRLVQPGFVHPLALRLAKGGYLHIATDWKEYADAMLATLEAEPLLLNTALAFATRPAYRPLTKFERRGIRLGHGVWDLVFRRRGA
jgi:tRNA (guanine-N7-)-methyltransferase